MTDNLKVLPKKLRLVREMKGISQDYLAQQLNISQNAYSLIEAGKSKLTIERLITILELLEITLDDLLALNEQVVFNKCKQAFYMNNTVYNYQNKIENLEQRLKDLESKSLQ